MQFTGWVENGVISIGSVSEEVIYLGMFWEYRKSCLKNELLAKTETISKKLDWKVGNHVSCCFCLIKIT